nr:MAG: hypothetical protein [Chemarfal virus 174]
MQEEYLVFVVVIAVLLVIVGVLLFVAGLSVEECTVEDVNCQSNCFS